MKAVVKIFPKKNINKKGEKLGKYYEIQKMLQIPALLSQPEHKLIVQIVGHRLTHHSKCNYQGTKFPQSVALEQMLLIVDKI